MNSESYSDPSPLPLSKRKFVAFDQDKFEGRSFKTFSQTTFLKLSNFIFIICFCCVCCQIFVQHILLKSLQIMPLYLFPLGSRSNLNLNYNFDAVFLALLVFWYKNFNLEFIIVCTFKGSKLQSSYSFNFTGF